MNDILMMAYDFIDEYKSKPEYKEYIYLCNNIDEKYNNEINSFKIVKQEYDEVYEIGRFHPDFKEVSKKFQLAKIKLLEIEDIKKYIEYERMIENDLNEVLNILGSSISSNIPVFNKFGFISGNKGGNCSGNCR